jgi:hypothetical protein
MIVKTISQTGYNNILPPKDPNTLYIITS